LVSRVEFGAHYVSLRGNPASPSAKPQLEFTNFYNLVAENPREKFRGEGLAVATRFRQISPQTLTPNPLPERTG